jgi:hypothetical protein
MIRDDDLNQPFHVCPGDTIVKRRVDHRKAVVQIDPGTEPSYIQTYADDIVRADYTDDNGNQVSQQESFHSEAPPLNGRPGHPTSYTLCSQSGGNRHLASLLPGQELYIGHATAWNLERWPGNKMAPYIIGTFGPLTKAGYVRCSRDTTQADSTTMLANASIS